jgi:hypothetical protein
VSDQSLFGKSDARQGFAPTHHGAAAPPCASARAPHTHGGTLCASAQAGAAVDVCFVATQCPFMRSSRSMHNIRALAHPCANGAPRHPPKMHMQPCSAPQDVHTGAATTFDVTSRCPIRRIGRTSCVIALTLSAANACAHQAPTRVKAVVPVAAMHPGRGRTE